MATSESRAVILFMSLPIMDGWDAARRLKANPYAKDISVLGLSAHAMTPDRDQAIAVSCDDCDIKPFDINHLPGKIQGLLGTSYAG